MSNKSNINQNINQNINNKNKKKINNNKNNNNYKKLKNIIKRNIYEPENIYKFRVNFINKNKNKITSKKKLEIMSNIIANVRYLGCIYDKKIMNDISKFSF